MNKIVEGIEAIIMGIGKKQGDAVIKAVDKKGLMNTDFTDIENEGGFCNIIDIAQKIYNNRKKLGLFTPDDIEIDVGEIRKIIDQHFGVELMFADFPKEKYRKATGDVVKAIADKKLIKIKDK